MSEQVRDYKLLGKIGRQSAVNKQLVEALENIRKCHDGPSMPCKCIVCVIAAAALAAAKEVE